MKMFQYDRSSDLPYFNEHQQNLMTTEIMKIYNRDSVLKKDPRYFGYWDDGLDFLRELKLNPEFTSEMVENVFLHFFSVGRDRFHRQTMDYYEGHILSREKNMRLLSGMEFKRKASWLLLIEDQLRVAVQQNKEEIRDIYYPFWLEQVLTEEECLELFNFLFYVGNRKTKYELFYNVAASRHMESKLWKSIISKAKRNEMLTMPELVILMLQVDSHDDRYIEMVLGAENPSEFKSNLSSRIATVFDELSNGSEEDFQFFYDRLRAIGDFWFQKIPVESLVKCIEKVDGYGRTRVIRKIARTPDLSLEAIEQIFAFNDIEAIVQSVSLIAEGMNEGVSQSNFRLESLVAML